MKIVVPLAGPDFDLADGTTKAETTTGGSGTSRLPLLRRTLENRPWWRRGDVSAADLVFVLHDGAPSRRFAREVLPGWYPGSAQVVVSRFTGGAALSAVAGVALVGHQREPIGIDLVDIEYDSDCDPAARMRKAGADALALTFRSDDPVYSYLRTDDAGSVVEAAEKRVISNDASAGTYFFAEPAVYLRALAHNLEQPAAVTHRGLFFVCPVYNGVIATGGTVVLDEVCGVQDIKVTNPNASVDIASGPNVS